MYCLHILDVGRCLVFSKAVDCACPLLCRLRSVMLSGWHLEYRYTDYGPRYRYHSIVAFLGEEGNQKDHKHSVSDNWYIAVKGMIKMFERIN